MGVFNAKQQFLRLGVQSFQPLGLWPIDRDQGSLGATGSQPTKTPLPTNPSGFYTQRASSGPTTGSGFNPRADKQMRPNKV